jgi:hypothetical protein
MLLAACGTGEVEVTREVEVEESVTETAQETVEVEKVVEVTAMPAPLEGQEGVLGGLHYGPHLEAYERMAAAFEELTGARLEVLPMDWPISQELIVALAAGTQLDIACVMGEQLTSLHI